MKAERFRALHVRGDPLVLFNAWDPGSARAVAAAGAKAVATGSWSVATAFGFEDGEGIPLDLVVDNARRIAAAVDVPVTIDFEGAYAEAPDAAATNVKRLAETGIVGINFEDRVVAGDGLYDARTQARRIAAIRRVAGPDLFINTRTDVFLSSAADAHRGLVDAAVERARAYADAGADGFFVPGLVDDASIGRICEESPLPVNVMAMAGLPPVTRLRELGVARISHGPGPYRMVMAALTAAARDAIG